MLYSKFPKNKAFKYDLEALVDAVNCFRGPYGRVAEVSEDLVIFDRCECIDETGVPKRCFPCRQRAILIEKVIYTPGWLNQITVSSKS
jgi:hypothetical protein